MLGLLVGIGSGAVCMLVGLIFGVAISSYKKNEDGFTLLAHELQKMSKKNNYAMLCSIRCLTCGFKAEGENYDDVNAEMIFHTSQQHPEKVEDDAASNSSRT